MVRLFHIIVLAGVLSAVPTMAGAASMAQQSTDIGGGMGTVQAVKNAGSYRLELDIGPLERMYTQAEARRMHPTHGEVMLRGSMAMGGMGSMGAMSPNHHLELHVMDRRSKRVVPDAMVSIAYQPVVGMGQMAITPQHVPIAVMRGLDAGMGDIHYGNNVYLHSGSVYNVSVTVNGVKAACQIRVQ